MTIRLCYWSRRAIRIVSFFSIVGTSAFFTNKVVAQITPDASLGAESSRVNPLNQLLERIDGGAIRGTSLFHSFQDFNIKEGRGAYFSNPAGIENIIGRVTGENYSQILGTLGVLGNANLYFINPNGIIFGPNSRLDINGSFSASTNSSILSDGSKFSSTISQEKPLLTVNLVKPIGFDVEVEKRNTTITNTGNLSVGQDLTFVADNIDLQGKLQAGRDLTLQAEDTVKIRDSATNPFIAQSRRNLVIQGNQEVDVFALNHPNSGLFSGKDMTLRSANDVLGDSHYQTGGNFRIEKLDGSLGNLFSPYDPVLLASGNVSLGDYTGASLHILAGGSVTLNNVTINNTDTEQNTISPSNNNLFNGVNDFADLANVDLSDKQSTSITVDGSKEPTLDIRAGIDWSQIGGLPIPDPNQQDSNSSFSNTQSTITSPPLTADITVNGTIKIDQADGSVLLTNQYFPNQTLPGGKIQVGDINTQGVDGNSGSIFIDSKGDIEPKGNIDTSAYATSGEANAGNIDLIAKGQFSLINNTINSDTYAAGKGGDIYIEAESVNLNDGGTVKSKTFGKGNGGNITLEVSNAFNINSIKENNRESGLFTASTGDGDDSTTEDGGAGNLKVNTRTLIVRNGGQLGSDNFEKNNDRFGSGKSGNINIFAEESVEVSGTSNNLAGADGLLKPTSIASFTINDKNAGDLTIETKRFTVKDGASITATTDGIGNSGILTIIADESMEVSGISSDGKGSRVRNATFGAGDSKDLIINTKRLVVKDGGRIDSRTQPSSFSNQNTGNAGNIKITTDIFEAYNGGQVISTTSGTSKFNSGDAGEININAGEKVILSGVDSSFEQRRNDLEQKLTKNFPTQTEETVGILLTSRISEGPASGVVAKDNRTGSAGNIIIETPFLLIEDGAQLNAETVSIEDGARLNAETVPGKGGVITLHLQDLLLMRRNGGITARAEGMANGGNVNINSGFVVAVPNEDNDIIARAVRGNGGNIKIDTQGIFGFQVSDQLTPRSDISASSDFGVDGVEEINAPDVDPSRGTVNLPDTPVNLNLAQGCQPSGLNSISRFATTGTASIPANPSDIQNIYTLWEDLRSPTAQNTDSVDSTDSKSPNSSADIPIKEAQGWIKTPDGKVKLVVKSPTVTPYSSWQTPSACDE